MNKASLLILALLVFFPAQALAGQKSGVYFGVRAGVHNLDANFNGNNTVPDDDDGGINASFAAFAGYDWSQDGFDARTEIEYGAYQIGSYDANNGTVGGNQVYEATVAAYALMINHYFDLENDSDFTPYIGGGIGFARIVSNLDFDKEAALFGQPSIPNDRSISSIHFAWNLSAGVAWELSESVYLDLQGRYMNFGSLDQTWEDEQILYEAEGDLSAFNTTLGLRFAF